MKIPVKHYVDSWDIQLATKEALVMPIKEIITVVMTKDKFILKILNVRNKTII